mgnify:FL=1
MNEVHVCVDLGTKATFFGLGLLASKKMRPYAKYFIVGGLALSAAPVVMQLVEKNKLNRIKPKEEVEEVALECEESCCCEGRAAEDTEAVDATETDCTDEADCADEVTEPCTSECQEEQTNCVCPEEEPEV